MNSIAMRRGPADRSAPKNFCMTQNIFGAAPPVVTPDSGKAIENIKGAIR